MFAIKTTESTPLLPTNTNHSCQCCVDTGCCQRQAQPQRTIILQVVEGRGSQRSKCGLFILVLCVLLLVPNIFNCLWSSEYGFDVEPLRSRSVFPSDAFSSVSVWSTGPEGRTNCTVVSGSHATVDYVIYSNDQDAQSRTQIAASIDENSEMLQVSVVYPKDLPHSSTRKLSADVTITLPKAIKAFSIVADIASLAYNGPNVDNSLKTDVKVGSSQLISPLNVHGLVQLEHAVGSIRVSGDLQTSLLTLKAKTGSIHVDNSVVSDRVLIDSSTGSVRAKLSGGFTNLEAHADVGSVDLSLSSDTSDAKQFILKSGTGSVKANIAGFVGHYSAKSGLGSVKVSGAIVHKTGSSAGFVGVDDERNAGTGIIDAKTGLGSVRLTF
ncbi:hypothetical protein BDR26DRAFT_853754, partial [Obelidium mucronatum]